MNINDAIKKLQDARDALASVLAAVDAVLAKVEAPPNAGSLVHTEPPPETTNPAIIAPQPPPTRSGDFSA